MFSTKFEVSADLTVTGLGFTLRHCQNDLWNSTMLSLINICVLFWPS